jgi:Homeodomain-like domain
MWTLAGWSEKLHRRDCSCPSSVELESDSWPPSCSGAWPARTSTPQAAYRAEIILRFADSQTGAAVAQHIGVAERTVWLWRHRFALHRLDGLKDRPKCPPPRRCHAAIQAGLLVLACQKPAEVDRTRAGQTHCSIEDLAQYVAAHPELGLGRPSKTTIGVILKGHKLRLDRL